MSKKINMVNNLFKKGVLEIVREELPMIRNKKYSDSYCLNMFVHVLKNVTNWSALQHLSCYPKNNKYHYKYLNQIFNKWNKHKIFEKAYTRLLRLKYFKLKHIEKSKTLSLFIDCTYISNMYGVDCKATNPEYRKKKVTKLSIVSDNKGNILSIVHDKTHLNVNNKKSFSHDTKIVQETLNNMNIKIARNIATKIGGDKGYISQKRFKLNNGKRVKIITPKRKNQRKRNTKQEKNYLKKRGIVEMSISGLKKTDRTFIRKDKKIINFIGFAYLRLGELFCTKKLG